MSATSSEVFGGSIAHASGRFPLDESSPIWPNNPNIIVRTTLIQERMMPSAATLNTLGALVSLKMASVDHSIKRSAHNALSSERAKQFDVKIDFPKALRQVVVLANTKAGQTVGAAVASEIQGDTTAWELKRLITVFNGHDKLLIDCLCLSGLLYKLNASSLLVPEFAAMGHSGLLSGYNDGMHSALGYPVHRLPVSKPFRELPNASSQKQFVEIRKGLASQS